MNDKPQTPEVNGAPDADVQRAHDAIDATLRGWSDPFPPAGFQDAVMARVAAAPRAVDRRRELFAGLMIIALTGLALGATLEGRGAALGAVGVGLKNSLVLLRGAATALLAAVNHAGALAVCAAAVLAVLTALALRRSVAGATENRS